MDLADRGRGKRMLVEVARTRARSGPPNSLRISFSRSAKRHRRDVVAQRRQAALQLILLVLGKAVELDHRDHLADLHRRAAHLPKLVDQLLRRAPRSARSGRLRPARACGPGWRFASRPTAGPDPSPARRPALSAPSRPVGSFPASGGHRRHPQASTEPSEKTLSPGRERVSPRRERARLGRIPGVASGSCTRPLPLGEAEAGVAIPWWPSISYGPRCVALVSAHRECRWLQSQTQPGAS